MFQKDALVVYGRTGVCRVTGVGTPDFCKTKPGEKEKLYYFLDPLYQDGTIYAPVDNAKVRIRPILTEEEAGQLLDLIPTVQAKGFYSDSTQKLREHYQTIMDSSDSADLMGLVMSIYAKKLYVEQAKRKFGAVDEHFMKQAEQLLNGELAAALRIPLGEVPDYIAARTKRGQKTPATKEA